jgi:hypothetical protein
MASHVTPVEDAGRLGSKSQGMSVILAGELTELDRCQGHTAAVDVLGCRVLGRIALGVSSYQCLLLQSLHSHQYHYISTP